MKVMVMPSSSMAKSDRVRAVASSPLIAIVALKSSAVGAVVGFSFKVIVTLPFSASTLSISATTTGASYSETITSTALLAL